MRHQKGRGVNPGLPDACSLSCRFRLRLGLGLLLRNRAARDLDYVLFDRRDGAVHTGPDADRESLIDGLADLLLEGDLVPLGDERCRWLEEPAAERDANAPYLAHKRGDALGAPGLDARVFLGGDAPGDDEETVGGAPDVGVALAQGLYPHLVQVWPPVDNR